MTQFNSPNSSFNSNSISDKPLKNKKGTLVKQKKKK